MNREKLEKKCFDIVNNSNIEKINEIFLWIFHKYPDEYIIDNLKALDNKFLEEFLEEFGD